MRTTIITDNGYIHEIDVDGVLFSAVDMGTEGHRLTHLAHCEVHIGYLDTLGEAIEVAQAAVSGQRSFGCQHEHNEFDGDVRLQAYFDMPKGDMIFAIVRNALTEEHAISLASHQMTLQYYDGVIDRVSMLDDKALVTFVVDNDTSRRLRQEEMETW